MEASKRLFQALSHRQRHIRSAQSLKRAIVLVVVLPNEPPTEEGDFADFCSNKSLLARGVPRIGRANQFRES